MDVATLRTLGQVGLMIPAQQMGLFVALISLFMLLGRIQTGLLVTFLFVLYWGYVLSWSNFVAAAGENYTALVIYGACGIAIVVLAMIAFISPLYS
jgi:hypothetical protein